MEDQEEKIKVCVIGAGAAGLCAVRHLAGNTIFEVTAYEQTNDIGGTWVYNEQVGLDENGLPIHSSMYQNLRTNLPAKIMNFPDYITMEGRQPSCVSHQEVLNYLKDYAQHFDAQQHIRFNTKVEDVRFISSDSRNRDKWSVQVKKLKTNETELRYFDAIMVCNGHYFDPYIPTITGIKSFPGLILHSHAYRKPDDYSGKKVLVLGAGSSGIDIGIDLSNKAACVYLSHNNDRLTSTLPLNMIQVAGVESIHETTFHLKDGTTVNAIDVFLLCTGYKYNFPFLDKNCGIQVDSNYVTPLYKHFINIEHPSMCIVGIPTVVLPFPMFQMQVQFFLAVLQNRATLPTKLVMLENATLKAPKKRHAHKLMNHQWDYNNSLAIAGGFDRLPAFYQLGYKAWSVQRSMNLLRYKDSKFVVSEDGQSVELVI
ncbi:PREDICTED: flavin-containing monooxygenase FMO GS-OX-like 2 [Vollenhovia emeryi]|uniref:flavin-containing monooxygenase FMO GS-OX-like 2 n=1 Tax=Vollenhovia emeryi TaxID=411798 RepID=UPI0005F489EC|nr:PREDICTED: flavin-containing monooxygenase FMO GS-OX-like 2 [Vollenhovia emeryi]XP_011875758.1 PREDICTED: flavin-containing monooxygenase FMO GS-OX-like 2 [Vollenhovia emeryi]XP_011875759.1 PREDICTED: flavin-containing monooxygenase FMO GS-OX-like 2 [Vollenhovia emeryi]XP_011875760.1 PREDICTED: flavin-containing monooxygenase FMO GS-OX-like 2 [Vollenhovia emeryi]XP_011875761.1 PREDICTED: flavin-containing monooxygenase FMO GS-OX-like 2 [Vollenhovia emeryi]XP_011875762.1 PREDICTED: flavin-co